MEMVGPADIYFPHDAQQYLRSRFYQFSPELFYRALSREWF